MRYVKTTDIPIWYVMLFWEKKKKVIIQPLFQSMSGSCESTETICFPDFIWIECLSVRLRDGHNCFSNGREECWARPLPMCHSHDDALPHLHLVSLAWKSTRLYLSSVVLRKIARTKHRLSAVIKRWTRGFQKGFVCAAADGWKCKAVSTSLEKTNNRHMELH